MKNSQTLEGKNQLDFPVTYEDDTTQSKQMKHEVGKKKKGKIVIENENLEALVPEV